MYEAVTADKYELPICYGESHTELARKLGVDRTTVAHAIKRGNVCTATYNKQRYKIVFVDEEE